MGTSLPVLLNIKPVLLYGSEIWGIFDEKKLNKLKDSYFNKNL
jgi:hypothetical protein